MKDFSEEVDICSSLSQSARERTEFFFYFNLRKAPGPDSMRGKVLRSVLVSQVISLVHSLTSTSSRWEGGEGAGEHG